MGRRQSGRLGSQGWPGSMSDNRGPWPEELLQQAWWPPKPGGAAMGPSQGAARGGRREHACQASCRGHSTLASTHPLTSHRHIDLALPSSVLEEFHRSTCSWELERRILSSNSPCPLSLSCHSPSVSHCQPGACWDSGTWTSVQMGARPPVSHCQTCQQPGRGSHTVGRAGACGAGPAGCGARGLPQTPPPATCCVCLCAWGRGRGALRSV